MFGVGGGIIRLSVLYAVYFGILIQLLSWLLLYSSKKMVAMWTCGDVFKTVYFVVRAAPAQFWICGSLQVMIDISIFVQVFIYRRNISAHAASS